MKLRVSFLFLATLLILASCRNSTNQREMAFAEKGLENTSVPPADQAVSPNVDNQIERKIIKTGDIRFETASVKQTQSVITNAVTGLGGYISNDNVYNSEDRTTYHIVVRVPADKFDELLAKISEDVKKFDSKNIDLQDVTEEFIDVETRIKTKKDLESRYKELLAKATAVSDILSIEKEMGTLRTDIEAIEGRLKYLKDRVNFSTLTIEFYHIMKGPYAFGFKVGDAVKTGWQWLLAFIVGVIHFWPFILLIGGGVLIALRIKRKRT